MSFTKNIARKLGLNLNQVKDTRYVKDIEQGVAIPKIIHQTYHSKKLTPQIELNIKNLKENNPDWEYRFYDDEDIQNYIKINYPEVLNIFNKINPSYGAARADLFRYLVMYKDGGIYLDIKSSLSKSLKEILKPNDQYILAYWPKSHLNIGHYESIDNPNGEFQQWHIICVKGHPFLKAVIENVCQNINIYNPLIHDVGMMGVLRTTGPIAYSLSILPLINSYAYRSGFDKDFSLVYSIFEGSPQGHLPLFKTHYRSLKESIIVQSRFINILFFIFNPIKNSLKTKFIN